MVGEHESIFELYINSLYFGFITMITVGYGDVIFFINKISPITINEKIYTMIMTLFSCALFAYAVNTIGSIFMEE